MKLPNRLFSVAPMMDCTDRHYRFLARLLSSQAWLYTEMVTSGALIHGDAQRFLAYNTCEHPVALQLGGSDPTALAQCSLMAQDFGYDEVNLNVGCPSDRVQSGKIGACLMAEPDLVAQCVFAMQQQVDIPVTVKTRIGIDHQEDYQQLYDFISKTAAAGCQTFIIHARKAWLQGLSPKENREIPPLKYEVVYQLKKDFPELEIIINGGIKTLDEVKQHLTQVDGVMMGREAYSNPFLLSSIDQEIYQQGYQPVSRIDVVKAYVVYMEQQWAQGVPLHLMVRHLLGLFQGLPGAKIWRRTLTENALKKGSQLNNLLSGIEDLGLEIS